MLENYFGLSYTNGFYRNLAYYMSNRQAANVILLIFLSIFVKLKLITFFPTNENLIFSYIGLQKILIRFRTRSDALHLNSSGFTLDTIGSEQSKRLGASTMKSNLVVIHTAILSSFSITLAFWSEKLFQANILISSVLKRYNGTMVLTTNTSTLRWRL